METLRGHIKRKQPKEELQHQQPPQEIFRVTADEGFSYVVRTTEDRNSFIDMENGTNMITFR